MCDPPCVESPRLFSPAIAIAIAIAIGCQSAPAPAPTSLTPHPANTAASAELASPTKHVRRPAVAGSFYPRDPDDLTRVVDDLLADAPRPKVKGGPIRALLSPHAGIGYSGRVAARAFKLVQGEARRRVIVLGPAHQIAVSGAAVEDFTHYRTPLGDIPLDRAAITALRAKGTLGEHDGAGAGEHSIEVVLPFLQRALAPGWTLVPVLVGTIDAEEARTIADALRPFADEHTLVVASGDLTHYGSDYGYLPFPRTPALPAKIAALDRGFYARLLDLDPPGIAEYRDKTGINACAYGPSLVLASLLSPDARPALVAYETSGGNTGSFRTSVSYAALRFAGPRAPADAKDALSRRAMKALFDLTLQALDRGVRTASPVDPDAIRGSTPLEARLEENGASFVTLTKRGDLRGCVGTVTPRGPLWRSVIDNAVAAARHDTRFPPVKPGELASIGVEVSVLSPLRVIASPAQIRLGTDGVFLEKGLRSAAFLPEVATEEGWDLPTLIAELAQKGDMPAHAWQDGARLSTFITQTFAADR